MVNIQRPEVQEYDKVILFSPIKLSLIMVSDDSSVMTEAWVTRIRFKSLRFQTDPLWIARDRENVTLLLHFHPRVTGP